MNHDLCAQRHRVRLTRISFVELDVIRRPPRRRLRMRIIGTMRMTTTRGRACHVAAWPAGRATYRSGGADSATYRSGGADSATYRSGGADSATYRSGGDGTRRVKTTRGGAICTTPRPDRAPGWARMGHARSCAARGISKVVCTSALAARICLAISTRTLLREGDAIRKTNRSRGGCCCGPPIPGYSE